MIAQEKFAIPVPRAMRESDLKDVLAIETLSFNSPWTLDNFRGELLRNPWSVNQVIEIDGRIVAYLTAWFVEGDVAINNIAIHPDFRRRGIALALVQWLLRDAEKKECERVTLEVRPTNCAAWGLYSALGFVEVGRRPNYYQQEGEDAIVMERICRRGTEFDG